MAAVKVVNATIIPDVDTVKEFIKQLKEQLTKDNALAQAFKLHPRQILSDRGLPYEFQSELLEEIEAAGPGVQCIAVSGCACTGCCATSWK